jgi:hypothetical protein
MQRWRPAAGAGALAVGVLAAVVAASTGPGGPAARQPVGTPSSAAPAAPTAPVVLTSCWVKSPTGNIPFSAEAAKRLTTVAARATDPDRREDRVRSAVDEELALPPDQAAQLTASLLGVRSAQRLTCAHSRFAVEPEEMGPTGLTPRARRLRAAWTEVFGDLIEGGFSRGGVSSGHVDSSSHYDGRAIDVFFRPHTDAEQRRRGRVFAQWLVAHAQDYHVLSVIFADQIWTSWASWGWREYVHPSGNRSNPVLRHLDHVHVAVESGRPYRG